MQLAAYSLKLENPYHVNLFGTWSLKCSFFEKKGNVIILGVVNVMSMFIMFCWI